MSRRDAERLLVRDGDFLVRESTTNPGQYVLTGMHCGLPKHLLLVDPEGVVSFFLHEHQVPYHKANTLCMCTREVQYYQETHNIGQ